MNLNIWFITTGLNKAKQALKGYNAFFRSDFPWEPSVLVSSHAAPSIPSILVEIYRPLFKAWLARGYSSGYNTKWSPTEGKLV